MPSLAGWNAGVGIAPDDWIWIEGQAEQALGYCALFWPDIEVVEDFILRAPYHIDSLRKWQETGRSRKLIEKAMNFVSLEGAFTGIEQSGEQYEHQLKHISKLMADMWDAKLRRDFPDRDFSVIVVNRDDDFGVTFHQI